MFVPEGTKKGDVIRIGILPAFPAVIADDQGRKSQTMIFNETEGALEGHDAHGVSIRRADGVARLAGVTIAYVVQLSAIQAVPPGSRIALK